MFSTNMSLLRFTYRYMMVDFHTLRVRKVRRRCKKNKKGPVLFFSRLSKGLSFRFPIPPSPHFFFFLFSFFFLQLTIVYNEIDVKSKWTFHHPSFFFFHKLTTSQRGRWGYPILFHFCMHQQSGNFFHGKNIDINRISRYLIWEIDHPFFPLFLSFFFLF